MEDRSTSYPIPVFFPLLVWFGFVFGRGKSTLGWWWWWMESFCVRLEGGPSGTGSLDDEKAQPAAGEHLPVGLLESKKDR